VRIVTATSKNLEKEIREGRFREDLFYRLDVFPIHLPALRDRRSDIMLLADSFVQKYSEVYNKNIRRISTAAINMMTAYHWPGNVRELENCIERAVLTAPDEVIHGYSLPPSLQTADQTNTALIPREGASLKKMLDAYEREVIIDALKKHRGSGAAAARDLQATPRIINYAIKRLGIQPANYSG
ncbi:MAG: sigma-54-dependent Fis family transcriptional regulator, partial [Verrucomicrobia bacterium]|nr:sigma-54-dependent Fis family transcriptional regulator [Verrucomicrobiota bacterium]